MGSSLRDHHAVLESYRPKVLTGSPPGPATPGIPLGPGLP
jgi:hypothetical protein